MITAADINWVAGFLEGEGSFGVAYHKKRSPTHMKTSVASAAQKQRQPLDKLQSLVGGKVYGPRANGMHQWRATAERARGIMMTLFGLLSPRRKRQVQKVLSENWHLSKRGLGYKTKMEKELI